MILVQLVTEYFMHVVFVHSDGRESHIVTKKFEVKQLNMGVNSHNDDNVNFSRTVSVNEVS